MGGGGGADRIFLGPKKGDQKYVGNGTRGIIIFWGSKRLDYSYDSVRIPNFGALHAHIDYTFNFALTVYEMQNFCGLRENIQSLSLLIIATIVCKYQIFAYSYFKQYNYLPIS